MCHCDPFFLLLLLRLLLLESHVKRLFPRERRGFFPNNTVRILEVLRHRHKRIHIRLASSSLSCSFLPFNLSVVFRRNRYIKIKPCRHHRVDYGLVIAAVIADALALALIAYLTGASVIVVAAMIVVSVGDRVVTIASAVVIISSAPGGEPLFDQLDEKQDEKET